MAHFLVVSYNIGTACLSPHVLPAHLRFLPPSSACPPAISDCLLVAGESCAECMYWAQRHPLCCAGGRCFFWRSATWMLRGQRHFQLHSSPTSVCNWKCASPGRSRRSRSASRIGPHQVCFKRERSISNHCERHVTQCPAAGMTACSGTEMDWGLHPPDLCPAETQQTLPHHWTYHRPRCGPPWRDILHPPGP